MILALILWMLIGIVLGMTLAAFALVTLLDHQTLEEVKRQLKSRE